MITSTNGVNTKINIYTPIVTLKMIIKKLFWLHQIQ